ncbi:MAG: cation transporting ATPase C-terminal domain-containing protein, partial [Sedimentibacter sp.]
MVLYVPIFSDIFNVVALSTTDWEIVLSLAFIPLVAGEVYKKIFKNK